MPKKEKHDVILIAHMKIKRNSPRPPLANDLAPSTTVGLRPRPVGSARITPVIRLRRASSRPGEALVTREDRIGSSDFIDGGVDFTGVRDAAAGRVVPVFVDDVLGEILGDRTANRAPQIGRPSCRSSRVDFASVGAKFLLLLLLEGG